MRILLPLAASLFAVTAAEAQTPHAASAPPAGTKVISGRHFDVYVLKKQETPMSVPGMTLMKYQVVAVAKTITHGTQRITRQVEVVNSDLLDSANWEIIDLDQDGFEDYRYVAQINKNGCRTWEAERWDSDHDRFTSAPRFAQWTDARNKVLSKSCN